ncbi:phage tail sheath subtilisin-like domain-containing protein, partial [Pseudomonas sp.]|uniref:phage tail sheath subtilisin-like domain-containing protein n=1 Tax=Pseudomonas sp. TaxID=306 RepID=UPI002897825E
MSGFFHGVTVTNVDTGARTIALPSSSIIGLVDTFTPAPTYSAQPNDLVLITSEREAIAAFGPDSAITKACQAIYTRAKAVIVACGVAKLEDAAEQTSAIIGGTLLGGKRTGLQALLDGKSRFNAQPRLLVTPKHSATQAVGTALVALADKLRAIAIIDGPNTTDEAAMAYAGEVGAKRAYMVDPGVQYWDTTKSATVDAPGSAYVAGLFAWTDSEYGFWASPSNKEFVGITGTSRPIEFLDGAETFRANLPNNYNG